MRSGCWRGAADPCAREGALARRRVSPVLHVAAPVPAQGAVGPRRGAPLWTLSSLLWRVLRVPPQAQGIGEWARELRVATYFAVAINVAVVCMSTSALDFYLGCATVVRARGSDMHSRNCFFLSHFFSFFFFSLAQRARRARRGRREPLTRRWRARGGVCGGRGSRAHS